MKKLVITGATGFLGKYAVNYFKDKYKVLGLSRSESRSYEKYSIQKTDYSIEELKRYFSNASCILHLAAGRTNNTSAAKLQGNIELDLRVFSVAQYLGVEQVVFISSRGVYGEQEAPWVETMPVAPNNFYSLAKAQSELAAGFFIREGLNIKILRIAQLLGLGEYAGSLISMSIRNSLKGESIHLTVEGIRREYIYIKDVLRGVSKAFTLPAPPGVYNLGSGELVTLKQIVEYAVKAFGNKSEIIESINKNIHETSLMNSDKFRGAFDWEPLYSLEEAMRDISEDLKDQEVAKQHGLSVN